MHNTIEYMLSRIYREIPYEILNQAFGLTTYQFQIDRTSLETNIRSKVIDNIVLQDCNIVSSNIITVPLMNLTWDYRDNGIVIHIPLSMTNNREILSVLSLEVVNRGLEPYAASAGNPSGTGTSEIYLVAPNTIFLPTNPGARNVHLRCAIANDPNLNGFSQRALIDLGELAVLAAKMYIYNTLAINIQITSMNGGSVDGQFRSIVDSYADAGEMYKELLQVKIRKLSLISDRRFHNRLIQMGLGK